MSKFILIGLLLSIAVTSFGQTPNSNDTLYMHPYELSDSVYGAFSPENIPSGKLLDRVLEPTGLVTTFDGVNVTDTLDMMNCLAIYTEMYWASGRTNLMDSPEIMLNNVRALWRGSTQGAAGMIPIGIVDYDYQYLDTLAYAQNLIYPDGLSLKDYGIQSNAAFHTGQTFAAAPLIISNSSSTVQLILKEEFIKTDKRAEMIGFEINYLGSWQSIDIDEIVNIQVGSGELMIGLRVQYSNGSYKQSLSSIETSDILDLSYNMQKSGVSGSFFDDGGCLTNAGVDLEYRVIYGCSDKEGPTKPVIILPGLQPSFITKPFEDLWDQMNFDQLLEDLVDNGHDVYITRLDLPNSSIKTCGDLLIELIKTINTQKWSNSSFYENVLIGLSMGGQVSRYALTKMEHDYLFSGGPPHHSRMYVSFDSPQHGVTMPLGSQLAVRSHATIPGDALAFLGGLFFWNELKAGGTLDLFYYHAKNYNMSLYNIENMTPNCATERTTLLTDLANFNPSSSNPGFPDQTRNIAVSLGDFNASAATFDEGEILSSKFSLQVKWWGSVAKFTSIRAAENSGGGATLFNRQRVSNFLWTVPIVTCWHNYKGSNMYEIDNCNASTNIGLHYPAVALTQLDGSLLSPGYVKISEIPVMPVLSALGVYPTSSVLPWNTEMSYNLQSVGLQMDVNASGIAVPSPNIGYPRLNYPLDHNLITPFEAFYCATNTNNHITVEDVGSQQSELADFIREEIMPTHMWFQNQNVGEYSPLGSTYEARYEVHDSIWAGKEVTYKTDLEPYIVQSNADITHRAGILIDLLPGFEAEFGSDYLAEIGPMGCWKNLSIQSSIIPGAENHPFEMQNQFAQNQVTSGSELTVYPNPSNGFLIVRMEKEVAKGTVLVTSLEGKEVFSKQFSGRLIELNLSSLSKGAYLVSVSSSNGLFCRQIILD